MRNAIMTSDELDDGSIVINFDEEDNDGICNTGGYVLVRKEEDHFIIIAFDGLGNIVNEYAMPFTEAYNGVEYGSQE